MAALFGAGCGPDRAGFGDTAAPDVGGTFDAIDETLPDTRAADAGFLPDVTDVASVDDNADTPPDDVAPTDASTPGSVFVYAHTQDELYLVDPRTFAVRSVAFFVFPSDGGDHRMTDIAITGDNQMWGVTFDTLYRIDTGTAVCTFAARLEGSMMFNGLSFIAGASGTTERLFATTLTGDVYTVDRATGGVTHVGSYGGGYGSSGDLVSVAGAGTFATVVDGNLFFPTEYLARIDETTGAATIIGPTTSSQTWGLGYWGGTLYGFTNGGQLETIDVTTGRATPISTSSAMWWGAGVTTRAPITHM